MDKQCKKCLRVKSLCEFYRHPQMSDGHLNKCKECTRADVQDNRSENVDYYKNYDRKRYDSGGSRGSPTSESIKRGRKRWSDSHRKERNAHLRLHRAIECGAVVRPPVCSGCGKRRMVDGHHSDYSKPLEVTWLCKECHGKTWRKERKELFPRKRGGYKGRMVASRV